MLSDHCLLFGVYCCGSRLNNIFSFCTELIRYFLSKIMLNWNRKLEVNLIMHWLLTLIIHWLLTLIIHWLLTLIIHWLLTLPCLTCRRRGMMRRKRRMTRRKKTFKVRCIPQSFELVKSKGYNGSVMVCSNQTLTTLAPSWNGFLTPFFSNAAISCVYHKELWWLHFSVLSIRAALFSFLCRHRLEKALVSEHSVEDICPARVLFSFIYLSPRDEGKSNST